MIEKEDTQIKASDALRILKNQVEKYDYEVTKTFVAYEQAKAIQIAARDSLYQLESFISKSDKK